MTTFLGNDAVFHNIGVTSVFDYGAKGDGTTDDTIAIQAAVNAAVSFGSGLVYFPTAVGYVITSTIQIVGARIVLRGDGGWTSPILNRCSTAQKTFNFNNSSPINDGCEVVGLYFPAPTQTGSGNVAISLVNTNGARIFECTIIGYNVGIQLATSYSCTIDGNTILSCLSQAIYYTDNSAKRAAITNNVLILNGITNTMATIYFNTGGFGILIAGNDIESNYIGLLFNGCSAVEVIGNEFDSQTNAHFYFTNGGPNEAFDFRGNYFGTCPSVNIVNVIGLTFENNQLNNFQLSWNSTNATLLRVGFNYLTAGATLGAGVSTFSSLPAASLSLVGQTYSITDSTTTTWGATITGGGSSHVMAYCNGTNWTVAAS